jgi:4'-phosphopantetheinyl transferase
MSVPFVDVENAAAELATVFAGVAVASAAVAQPRDGGRDWLVDGLEQRERVVYEQLRCAPRRAQFVAGRVAARRAVARLLRDFAPRQAEILKDSQGAPFVVGHPSVRVSISHSNGVALAVAAHVPVGIDLEADDPRPAAFARLFFSAAEQRRLCTAGNHAQQTLLNTLWTRKEAVSKVGHWGGALVFAALDCLDSSVLIEGCAIEVRSVCAAGYVLSLASAREGRFGDG